MYGIYPKLYAFRNYVVSILTQTSYISSSLNCLYPKLFKLVKGKEKDFTRKTPKGMIKVFCFHLKKQELDWVRLTLNDFFMLKIVFSTIRTRSRLIGCLKYSNWAGQR